VGVGIDSIRRCYELCISSGSLAAMERNALASYSMLVQSFKLDSWVDCEPCCAFRPFSAQATVAFERRFGKFLETAFGGF
jgi:hypothetical protein